MRPAVRVLQVLGRSAGGIARHVATIGNALGSDPRFEIATAAPSRLPIDMPNRALTLEIPDGPTGHRAIVDQLRDHVMEQGYEVVHAHGLRAGIDAGRAARHSAAHRVVTVHNLVRPEVAGRMKAPLYRVAEPLCLAASDHVFCVSEDIASTLRRRRAAKGRPIEVLHLGSGPAPEVSRTRTSVRRNLDVDDDGALVVTVARLSAQKSLHVLIDALALLRGSTVLAILGEGPLEGDLKTRAEEAGVAPRVRWLGFRPDVADHIAAADVFCLSSVWEGVPLAAMEAIALGTPIVATAVGGMTELIRDGVTGTLVNAGDVRALSLALDSAIQEPERARGMAERARAFLETEFSTQQMVDRLAAHYLAAVHVG